MTKPNKNHCGQGSVSFALYVVTTFTAPKYSYTARLYTERLYTAPMYTAPMYTAPMYTASMYTAVSTNEHKLQNVHNEMEPIPPPPQ